MWFVDCSCTESLDRRASTSTCGMDLSYSDRDASEPASSGTGSDTPSLDFPSSFLESEGANFSSQSSGSEVERGGSSASQSSESDVEGGSYLSHFSESEGGSSSSTKSEGSPHLTSSSSFEADASYRNPLNSERLKAASEKTLYEGAQISILLSYLLIFQFVINHSLSGKAFTELLQLLSIPIYREALTYLLLHRS